ncbi:TPA: hypothetical protein EYP66_19830 [Candidatus Poribacteria bacterium]|nr:hypothetical protein [Candidatus Poribacteria bacterium]
MSEIDYSQFIPVREFPDRGIKWLLESKENVHALLDIVASDIAKNLDFSKLEKLPQSFIPDNLRKQESDLLFLVPFHDEETDKVREVVVYILIEHQSTPDRVMNFRLLFYMLQIWDSQRRAWLNEKIPKGQWNFRPILPIVFYTGEQSWAKLLSMAELMDLPKALERFVPHHDTLFLNLKTKPKEELIADGHPFGYLLQVIQKENATKEEVTEAIELAVKHFDSFPSEQQNQWAKLMYYLVLLIRHRRGSDEQDELISVVKESIYEHKRREEVEEMGRTAAQELIEQGIAQGIAQGIEQGIIQSKQEDLLELMKVKFDSVPQSVTDKIKRMQDTGRLNELIRKILTVRSIDEMGI